MDKELKEFIRKVANTVTKLEILSYFQQHPYAMDNAGGVARWLNRGPQDVTLDLQELAASGLVLSDGAGEPVYSFNSESESAALVAKAVEAFNLTRDTVYDEVLARQQEQDGMRRRYQRLLDTEKGKTETILNSLAESVVVVDRTGRVLSANESFLSTFTDGTAGFAPGAELTDLGIVPEVAALLVSDGDIQDVDREIAVDERSFQFNMRPVSDGAGKMVVDEQGRPAAYVSVFRDISGEKEMEQMREDFVRMLSHDLKNPLGIIYGSSTLVLDGKLGLLNEKQKKLLGNVVKCCGQMEKLIEDFLTLSRLEAGQLVLRMEKIDLGALVKGVVDISATQFEQKDLTGLYHPCEQTLTVSADPVQLERVVSNLVGNAVKYNRDGGRVDVFCRREGEMAQVEVADTGLGIPAGEVPHIFDKFRRSAAVERMKGSGLGLTICRDLVEAMGGTISAESEEGRGSRFSFLLPLYGENQ